MADNHKTTVHENADRVIEWLLEHRTEFEESGVEESSLAGAVGLSAAEITEAVDYLESHEDLARFSEGISDPPRFLLKPARGWQATVARPRAQSQAGDAV
ncbi:MAG TPA: hypothetical protein VKA60_12050 [Blastocatellia bacterium]|nr:hypothetical protein [Blastocatellia bacterium]